MCPTDQDWRQARINSEARHIADAIDGLLYHGGSVQGVRDVLQAEWQQTLSSNGGNQMAAEAEWKQIKDIVAQDEATGHPSCDDSTSQDRVQREAHGLASALEKVAANGRAVQAAQSWTKPG